MFGKQQLAEQCIVKFRVSEDKSIKSTLGLFDRKIFCWNIEEQIIMPACLKHREYFCVSSNQKSVLCLNNSNFIMLRIHGY